MKSIILSDVTDIHKVAAALQEAVDQVLNATSLSRLLKDRFNDHDYQHVHPGNGQPAVARVDIVVGGVGALRDMTTLSVNIKRPGGNNRRSASAYVPPHIIQRLRVRLNGGSLFRPQAFRLNGPNNEASARLSLPTATFQRFPQALIEIED